MKCTPYSLKANTGVETCLQVLHQDPESVPATNIRLFRGFQKLVKMFLKQGSREN